MREIRTYGSERGLGGNSLIYSTLRRLFKNVAYGEYKIKETTAPRGYNLSDTVLDPKIESEGQEIDLTSDPVSNTKIRGNIEILKRNGNTHRPLSGAIISVYTENSELIDEKLTGDSGLVRFENLVFGRYYFQETKAPSGYILDYTKYPFDIEENDVTLERNLDNTRRSVYPPGLDKPDPVDPGPTDPKDPPKEEDPDKPVDPENPDPEDPENLETPDPTDPDRPRVPEEFVELVPNPPTKGTITFDENGNWIYTPNPGATGEDTFTIIIDGVPQTITINLDDIPLGTTEITKETLAKLPKTGAASNLGFYLGGLSLIFLGIFLRKRKVA